METVNQEVNATQEQQEAKFTQADLDRIVKDRLTREREKYGDYDALKAKAEKFDEIEEASKTELQKATEKAKALQDELDAFKKAESLRTMREKVAHDTGVPVNLLTAESEDACKEQAKQILEFSRPSGYPQVKDGGEVRTSGKKSTRDSFAEWFNNQ
jgi:hypothetical protein